MKFAVLSVPAAAVAMWAAASLAQQPSSQPAEARPVRVPRLTTQPAATTQPVEVKRLSLTVARVDGPALFSGFSRADELQSEFARLQMEARTAQQAKDAAKVLTAMKDMEKLRERTRKQMNTAIEDVAKRERIDLVIGDVLYDGVNANVPDITQVVVAHLNASAATQPASAPAK